tara:strand:- start:52 stop:930 length:879 start_codon:yes stop_codon:yes gene_type:complete
MSDKKYTVIELKKMCKHKGIKGYSKLRKKELMKKCLGLPPPSETPKKKKKRLTEKYKKTIKENITKLLDDYTKFKKREGVFTIETEESYEYLGSRVYAVFSHKKPMKKKIKAYLNRIGLKKYDIEIVTLSYDSRDRLIKKKQIEKYMYEPQRPDLSKYTKEYIMKKYKSLHKPFYINIDYIKFIKAYKTQWTSKNNTIEIGIEVFEKKRGGNNGYKKIKKELENEEYEQIVDIFELYEDVLKKYSYEKLKNLQLDLNSMYERNGDIQQYGFKTEEAYLDQNIDELNIEFLLE